MVLAFLPTNLYAKYLETITRLW